MKTDWKADSPPPLCPFCAPPLLNIGQNFVIVIFLELVKRFNSYASTDVIPLQPRGENSKLYNLFIVYIQGSH